METPPDAAPEALPAAPLEVAKEAKPEGPQVKLYMDDNQKVYRLDDEGKRHWVVQFDNPESEKLIKYELYLQRYIEKFKTWMKAKPGQQPPLVWDDKNSKWVWLDRAQRRASMRSINRF